MCSGNFIELSVAERQICQILQGKGLALPTVQMVVTTVHCRLLCDARMPGFIDKPEDV